MRVDVTTWHLELTDPGALISARPFPPGAQLQRVMRPDPALNRFLYTAVGGGHFWVDRLSWTWARWMAWLGRPELEIWLLSCDGGPAGYFELEHQPDAASVEIVYFGLLPQWVGRGLGGPLLEAALRRGFEREPARVWVHTCSLDHPAARAAYAARGMVLFQTEVVAEDLPDLTPGPWPGAEASPPG